MNPLIASVVNDDSAENIPEIIRHPRTDQPKEGFFLIGISSRDRLNKLEEDQNNVEDALTKLKRQYAKLQKDFEDLQQERDFLKITNAGLVLQIEKLQEDLQQLQNQKSKLEEKLRSLQDDITRLKQEHEETIDKMNKKISKLQADNVSKDAKLSTLEHKLSQSKSTEDSLQDQIDDLQKRISGMQRGMSVAQSEKRLALQEAQTTGVDAAQILIRKLATTFANRIITEVLGAVGTYGIFTLKSLKKWAERNPLSPEAAKWTPIAQTYKIDDTFLGTLVWLIQGGNDVAHDLKVDDFKKAKAAIKYYSKPVQNNVLEIVSSAEKLLSN